MPTENLSSLSPQMKRRSLHLSEGFRAQQAAQGLLIAGYRNRVLLEGGTEA